MGVTGEPRIVVVTGAGRGQGAAFARRVAADGMTAPSLDYRAREIRDGLVPVHWIVKQAAIHVALTVDLIERRIHVGAMMPPNRWEFFDTGEIVSITRHGVDL